MPNKSGRAYGLTTLCPLIGDHQDDQSYAAIIKGRLRNLAADADSPWAKIPNLYLCRMFVLDDVFYQGKPAHEEHLKSKYLVFVAELHGELEPFLEAMWRVSEDAIREIWEFCVAFKGVCSTGDFVRYIKQCQVETTFYFNGSNDESLAEQLKALYLKQEFGKFVREHQLRGQDVKDAAQLQRAFTDFVARVEPFNLAGPTWRPGATDLAHAVVSAPVSNRT